MSVTEKLSRKTYLLITLITFLLCVIIFIFGPAFPFIRGTMGDFLVVILIYGTLLFVWPKLQPLWTGIGVFGFAVTVEFLQSNIIPTYIDTSRTLVQATIGSHFDPFDIVAYFLGTTLIVIADAKMRR